jgi:hypothetical protein
MKSWLVGLGALAGLWSAPADAGTIVQTQGATLIDVGKSFAVPLEFNRFNPALGTLDGVTLDLSAFFSGSVGIENVSNSPDVAHGIIAGTVTAATSDASLLVEVSPSAAGPSHDFTAFDGTLDFAGTSGATDMVTGAPATGSASVPPPPTALSQFIGAGEIFLTLTATSFPVAEGHETESVTETADAHTTDVLIYSYTPFAVGEPASAGILMVGLLGLWRRRKNFP